MFLIYLARVVEWLFFIGLAGSLVVSLAAFFGDLHIFFENDDEIERKDLSAGSAGADD
ncbi:MAG TPA: hypothetical protein VFP59_10610 [Candidatus Angelobacter sp.]|nr:hypothetical protein [Candidatus Angelobacter sp.]